MFNSTESKKVSVLLCSFNHAKFIQDAVDSVVNQDYKGPIELVIIDDASTDDTKNILSRVTKKSRYNREIRVIYKKENKGLNDSIERGLSIAGGHFVQLLSSDDMLCPSKITLQSSFLNTTELDCVYSRGYTLKQGNLSEFFLNEFKREYDKGRALRYVSVQDWGGPLAQSALFSKCVLTNLMNIRKSFKSDDWAMLIYLFKNKSVGYLDMPLFIYRQHEKNTFKNYNYTMPMRYQVVLNLVDENWQAEAFSNILYSQAQYLYYKHQKQDSLKFILASIIFKLQLRQVKLLGKHCFPKKFIHFITLRLSKFR